MWKEGRLELARQSPHRRYAIVGGLMRPPQLINELKVLDSTRITARDIDFVITSLARCARVVRPLLQEGGVINTVGTSFLGELRQSKIAEILLIVQNKRAVEESLEIDGVCDVIVPNFSGKLGRKYERYYLVGRPVARSLDYLPETRSFTLGVRKEADDILKSMMQKPFPYLVENPPVGERLVVEKTSIVLATLSGIMAENMGVAK